MFYRIDTQKTLAMLIDDRRRKRRHRAAPAQHADTCLTRLGIEAGDTGDKRSAIRQVAIIHARLDAMPGHGVRLPLKRPRGVDKQINAQLTQLTARAVLHDVHAPALAEPASLRLQCGDLFRQLARVTTGNDQIDVRHQHQMITDEAAEVTVATDDQYAKCH